MTKKIEVVNFVEQTRFSTSKKWFIGPGRSEIRAESGKARSGAGALRADKRGAHWDKLIRAGFTG